LIRIAKIDCALLPVIIRIVNIELDKIALTIAPALVAISLELRIGLAEWLEQKAAHAVRACRCSAAPVARLRAILRLRAFDLDAASPIQSP
jgi:hypothetical protein